MKLGISTATFFGKILTEDSFEVMEKMNAEVCEVFLTTFYEYNAEFAALLKSRNKNLKVHSIHSLNNQYESELYNKVLRTRSDAESIFKKVCACGETINAQYYTFHGPARLKKKAYVLDYQYLGKRTEELCEIAKSYNLELCYENVHWTFYSENGFFKNLKQYSPSIKACLDIKQAMQSKIDYKLFIEDMGTDIRTVHLCDYDENGNLCVPGSGIFDFKELFKILKNSGFNGSLILELYSGDYKSFEELERGYYYLKNLIK